MRVSQCDSDTCVSHYQYRGSRTPCTMVECSGSNKKKRTDYAHSGFNPYYELNLEDSNLNMLLNTPAHDDAPSHQVLFTRRSAAQKKPRQKMRWTHTGINLPAPPPSSWGA